MEPKRFNTVFTTACHWSLSWVRCIHSLPSHPISLGSVLILLSHLRLRRQCVPFPSCFPTTLLYTFLVSSMGATWPTHLIFLEFITLIIFGEAYEFLVGRRVPFLIIQIHCCIYRCCCCYCHYWYLIHTHTMIVSPWLGSSGIIWYWHFLK
jgi:hypothetical protein